MRLLIVLPALVALAVSCSDPTDPRENEVLAVVSGNAFSCALVGERVYCWGRNEAGQLGRGEVSADGPPGLVSGEQRFRLIAASERTVCGVTVFDTVFCWGHGRITGSSTSMTSPTQITGTFPPSITSMGLGYSHGCVRAAGGIVTCFGTNSNGELGDGTVEPSTGAAGATTVVGGHAFGQIAVGGFHTCGIEGGTAWCWGINLNSSFGPGTTASAIYSAPRQLVLGFAPARVDAGSALTCVHDALSQPWCWGTNVAGQLGRGAGTATASSATPERVTPVSSYGQIALSRLNSTVSHACSTNATGTAFCWGAAEASQLGREGTETCAVGTVITECSPMAAAVESDLSFTWLAPGRDHTCGLTTGGEIYCWGAGARMQLGSTVSASTRIPVRVTIPD